MTDAQPQFETRLVGDARDLEDSQRLRYKVFVEELGGDGEHVDHTARLERDAFDPLFDHLILLDHAREANDRVVGVYRMMRCGQLPKDAAYYSEGEYDLTALKASGRKLLELGRSCLHPDYRGGLGMYHLWQGLSDYVDAYEIEVMFGVASFHGTDVDAVAQSLSHLHHAHLAPKELRPRSLVHQRMDLIAPTLIDRRAAMRGTPALIKAYLRMGGMIGDGAYIDHEFNTVDVCLVMDTAKMPKRHRDIYTKPRAQKQMAQ